MKNDVEVHYSPACEMIEVDDCCGCGVCGNVCPQNAIKMVPSEEGFLYPVIDQDKCDNCKKCMTVCPIIQKKWMNAGCSLNDCYMGYGKDKNCLLESSSGGFFYSVAKTFVENGCEVYGVAWNETFDKASYICASTLNDLERIRKSKYIQSEKGDVYRRVKDALDRKTKVLFSGCGCDIAALKNYLNGNDTGLYTVELICHGPTSPKYLTEWIEYLKKTYRADVVDLEMRSKKEGNLSIPFKMRVTFSNGKIYERDFFNTAFGYVFSNVQRLSCYQCKFKSSDSHVGDVTVGDAYGELTRNEAYNKYGTSVVVINTDRGRELFGMADNFFSRKVEYDTVLSNIPRLSSPWEKSPQRKQLTELETTYGLVRAVDMVCGKKRSLRFHLPEKFVFLYDHLVHGISRPNKKIHVLIDFQALIMQNYGGVSHYTYEIVNGLLRDKLFELHLPVMFSINSYFKEIIKGKTWKKPKDYLIWFRLNKLVNLIYTWIYVLFHRIDIYHPSYHMPYVFKALPPKTKVVVTVHDLIHELFPDEANSRVILNRRKSLQRADSIIAVSDNTKEDLLRFYPDIKREKIKVIHEGGRATDEVEEIKNLPRRFILYVGERKGYKNFLTFYKAVTILLDQFMDLSVLCIGGGPFKKGEIEEKYKSRIFQMVCSNEELNYVYQNATCFVFPSLYEGFGIPIIEAFENGCPVILSNCSCFPEIAGDAALYFDANGSNSVEDLRQKIMLYISDKELRMKMVKKGMKRADLFTWDKMQASILQLYKSLSNHNE